MNFTSHQLIKSAARWEWRLSIFLDLLVSLGQDSQSIHCFCWAGVGRQIYYSAMLTLMCQGNQNLVSFNQVGLGAGVGG